MNREHSKIVDFPCLLTSAFTLVGCAGSVFKGATDRRSNPLAEQGKSETLPQREDIPGPSTPSGVAPPMVEFRIGDLLQADSMVPGSMGPVANTPSPPPLSSPQNPNSPPPSTPSTPQTPSPPPVPPTPEEILKKCETSAALIKEKTQEFVFARSAQTCQFGLNGNLPRKQAFVQAVGVTTQKLELPAGTLCSMELRTTAPNAQLRYDDFISLTLNSHVLFFSNNTFLPMLAKSHGIYQWDFARLRGQPISNFDAAGYCVAQAGTCVFPGHDRMGPVSINLLPPDMAPMAATLTNQPSATLSLNTTGDDNDTDCIHTEINFSTVIKYLPK